MHMKRKLLSLASLVLSVVLLCGCSANAQELLPLGEPRLAVLGGTGNGEYPTVSVQEIVDATQVVGLDSFTAEGGADQLATLAAEQKATVFAVCLANASDAPAYVRAAAALGLPVIFCGEKPDASVLQQYSKCWYVGASPAKQGELLGEALFADYQAGRIPDKNGDKLLQVVIFTGGAAEDSRATATLRIFENRGVFNDTLAVVPVGGTSAEEQKAAITATLLQQTGAELILASTPALAAAATEAVATVLPGVPVGTFGDSNALGSYLDSGAILATVYYQNSKAAGLVATFAQNAALGRDPTVGTDARLDENHCTLVDFITKTTPQPQATPLPEPAETTSGTGDE